MPAGDLDLLDVQRGLVVAPAGCGKTQLIANALSRNQSRKPVLVLTHTNAGVAALRSRLARIDVPPRSYQVGTIDGWAIRLVSTFPGGADFDLANLNGQRPNYAAIRRSALHLLTAGHVNDVIAASYSRLLVDEYQDCSTNQHAIVAKASEVLPTCVVGDPLQAIFGFGDDPLPHWDSHVCGHFPTIGQLDRPWRWINADSQDLGEWLLDQRRRLLASETVDLGTLPGRVSWVQLDGTAGDYPRQLRAGNTRAPNDGGSVLIIGDSRSPPSQQRFASQINGAVTVEAVDLRDLVAFAERFNLEAPDALAHIIGFTQKIMSNVGGPALLDRIERLSKGTARTGPSEAEAAALAFLQARTHASVVDLLVAINKEAGVRVYRPAVLRACVKALQMCGSRTSTTFHEAAVRMREQNRAVGRTLPKRAVGSTLLLKGLEADVAVILDADEMCARNLYVGMTRGSRKLVVCSRTARLRPPLG